MLPGSQENALHVLVTRHPYEWLDSMRRNGFYTNFHRNQVIYIYIYI